MTPSPQATLRGDSRVVTSNQDGPHRDLAARVRRHLATPWQQPLHRASKIAFRRVEAWRSSRGAERPVVLDAGCGTGESTRRLAARHPAALVVGVDRSAARLARVGAGAAPRGEDNAFWVRAELTTFWRLALAARWPVTHHYLLYPNPWPKSAQLGRRWHGHPVFPDLLALGGRLELRSNWEVYVEEFALAVGYVTGESARPERLPADKDPLTPFERKYAASGHELWRWAYELPKRAI